LYFVFFNRPALKIRVTRRALPIWTTILCLVCLLFLSGLFSGLNLGLMSLTPHDLLVIQEAGTEDDRKYAKRIYPVRKHGNFLLCTILLGNVLVNSTTTILLDALISGALAVACATLAIVIFGEILPQAICSRHGLKVGSKTILLTRLFMILTWPISKPLSKLLDIILGEEVGARYTRDQMSALLKHTATTDIEDREKNIMTGVLSLRGKKIRGVMTNLEDVFMLEANRIVDDELVLTVYGYGYSRIPVYEEQKFV
jgi:metal transporter CNNM